MCLRDISSLYSFVSEKQMAWSWMGKKPQRYEEAIHELRMFFPFQLSWSISLERKGFSCFCKYKREFSENERNDIYEKVSIRPSTNNTVQILL